jgi:hypothetical protein
MAVANLLQDMNSQSRFFNEECLLRIAQDAQKHLNTAFDIRYPEKIILR